MFASVVNEMNELAAHRHGLELFDRRIVGSGRCTDSGRRGVQLRDQSRGDFELSGDGLLVDPVDARPAAANQLCGPK